MNHDWLMKHFWEGKSGSGAEKKNCSIIERKHLFDDDQKENAREEEAKTVGR